MSRAAERLLQEKDLLVKAERLWLELEGGDVAASLGRNRVERLKGKSVLEGELIANPELLASFTKKLEEEMVPRVVWVTRPEVKHLRVRLCRCATEGQSDNLFLLHLFKRQISSHPHKIPNQIPKAIEREIPKQVIVLRKRNPHEKLRRRSRSRSKDEVDG
ncbi:hypothetical protein NL676_018635 [Syzygium grande]|nr:hypothetical protein NL676_018635 [Syzygium grande]